MKNLAKIVVATVVYVAVFDLLGVGASFFLDVTPVRGKSGMAFYAIWFVLGAFCGFLHYNQTGGRLAPEGKGDWSSRPETRKTGLQVICGTAVVVAALVAVCYALMWKGGVEGDYFVPDNMPLSLTFFVAMLAAMILAHVAFRPDKTT